VDLNVKVTFEIVGNAVGTFNLGYDYYQTDDTYCSGTFVGTFHTTCACLPFGPHVFCVRDACLFLLSPSAWPR
jgi:hypothetical protein